MNPNLSYKDCLLNSSKNEDSENVKRLPPGLIKLPPGLHIPSLNNNIRDNNDFYIKNHNIKRTYSKLDLELNKNRALSSFKNNLINRIIRYLREKHKMFNVGKLKYTRAQMYNHFPNWFFKLNNEGAIIDFIPQIPFKIQTNLDYILKENNITKKADFDPRLLTFNSEYIKNDLFTIDIVKRNKDNHVKYHLNYNNGIWKLLPITLNQYRNLKSRYRGSLKDLDEYISIILLRYRFLGGVNNHLSIPIHMIQKLRIDVELFATPFNVYSSKYCSPFYDIEQYFGSYGSFMNYQLMSQQVYLANPPYDVQMIEDMALKFEKEMEGLKETTIYITIPLWKEDFPGYDILMRNPYLKDHCELKKELFPFFHYFKNLLIPASDTYLLVLSTHENPSNYYSCLQLKKIWNKKR